MEDLLLGLSLVLLLRMGCVRLPPVVQSWQSLDLLSLDELHEVTSMCFRQSTSNDAFAATMRKALLADSTYHWTALRAGIGPMRACWRRYQDINMIPPAKIVGAIGIIHRRFGATWKMTDEEKSCSCWILPAFMIRRRRKTKQQRREVIPSPCNMSYVYVYKKYVVYYVLKCRIITRKEYEYMFIYICIQYKLL